MQLHGRMDGCGHGGSFRRKPNVGAPEAAEALRRNVHYQRIVAHAAVRAPRIARALRNRCDLETGFREKASGAELACASAFFSTSWQNRRSATRGFAASAYRPSRTRFLTAAKDLMRRPLARPLLPRSRKKCRNTFRFRFRRARGGSKNARQSSERENAAAPGGRGGGFRGCRRRGMAAPARGTLRCRGWGSWPRRRRRRR